MPIVSPRALAAIPVVIVFAAVGLVLVVLVPVYLALPVALVLGLVTAWLVVRSGPARLLRHLGAEPLEEAAEPRLESLVESLCASNGIAEPRLYLVDTDAIDSLVVGRGDETRLVVTSGALRRLDRLELEAVVARQLSLLGSGTNSATVLAAVTPFLGPLAPRLRSRLLDDRRLARADIDGVKLTRYPPALASTFEKASKSERISDQPVSRHLWMVGPEPVGHRVQPPIGERIDTLREL